MNVATTAPKHDGAEILDATRLLEHSSDWGFCIVLTIHSVAVIALETILLT